MSGRGSVEEEGSGATGRSRGAGESNRCQEGVSHSAVVRASAAARRLQTSILSFSLYAY